MSGPVVVGVDGTPSGLATVEAAAREADRRGVALRLTHAFAWPSGWGHLPRPSGSGGGPPGVPSSWGAGTRAPLNGAFTEAEDRARRAAPHVTITQSVLLGEPTTVLESESRTASLTVVGGRRAQRYRSVARRLTAHCRAPVLVMRGEPDRSGPVVLADDASPASRAAAEFAFAEASERGTDLVVLHTRTLPAHWSLSALSKKYPDVGVRRRRMRVRDRRALVEASAVAQLVVVGARSRALGVPPGTVGWTALRRARCPVAVVPNGKA